ncbi:MAG TPA: hotdog fold thioesterase [Candidatus Hydrogenedentes bacterium]|nr:hotdog fold thioesterase [Candidatus Hydrogenedentota bacterium]HRK36322.1 hotdog fold thioesterase [Candidatus Hydrogenedentota bacterium]
MAANTDGKSIWYTQYSLAQLNALAVGTIHEVLGIHFTEIGADFLSAKMPVDNRTAQPAGLLHGGASVVLAESLGSMGSYLLVDPETCRCVGLDVNANHVRSANSGHVIGTARPIHIGKSTHVWEIRVCNDADELICISRLTMAIRCA